ncbi:putative 1,4-beta-D-glucan cellobiohydrolase A [Rhizoctonia solani]|uniref:Glucanase n=1 Tax=Rhizoctonia solani TaxID=456999 RepID=A0A0K6GA49_9AGAM|nr:putative 1,4-beta-D-glucan cellobiohydrolase A [Rhizoctonia solani]
MFVYVFAHLSKIIAGPGTVIPELHPALSWQLSTKSSGCQPQPQGPAVLDSEWRWVHAVDSYSNRITKNSWDFSLCSNPATCAKNCELGGIDYTQFGTTTSSNSLTLRPTQTNYKSGSRVYLIANETSYQLFKLKNQELRFDVDAGNIPWGFGGGLYFGQMDADSSRYGTYCNEIDIWEANSYSTVSIANPCTVQGQTRCSGSECTSYCDSDGCDFNPYRLGNLTYYGHNMNVGTEKKITVVTQFITADNTTTSALGEIRRLHIQNGKVIQNAKSLVAELSNCDFIIEKYFSAQNVAFSDPDVFASKGGFQALGDASDSGLILVMSVSGNGVTQMRWLDSVYRLTVHGPTLALLEGFAKTLPVESQPMASVTFSNLRFGDIGLTYSS